MSYLHYRQGQKGSQKHCPVCALFEARRAYDTLSRTSNLSRRSPLPGRVHQPRKHIQSLNRSTSPVEPEDAPFKWHPGWPSQMLRSKASLHSDSEPLRKVLIFITAPLQPYCKLRFYSTQAQQLSRETKEAQTNFQKYSSQWDYQSHCANVWFASQPQGQVQQLILPLRIIPTNVNNHMELPCAKFSPGDRKIHFQKCQAIVASNQAMWKTSISYFSATTPNEHRHEESTPMLRLENTNYIIYA